MWGMGLGKDVNQSSHALGYLLRNSCMLYDIFKGSGEMIYELIRALRILCDLYVFFVRARLCVHACELQRAEFEKGRACL